MKKMWVMLLASAVMTISWPVFAEIDGGLVDYDQPTLSFVIGVADIGISTSQGEGIKALPNHTSPYAVVGAMDRSWSSVVTFEPQVSAVAFHIEDPGRYIVSLMTKL